MARIRWKHINYLRKSLQLTVLVLLGYMVIRLFIDPSYFPAFEAYCPLGGMQALASFSVSETLACSMTSMQIALGVMLLIGAIVFSKLFCGYVCPIGTFTEWLGKIGERFRVRLTITGIADRLLRSLKYGLLFLTFYFTVEASELFCRQWDPYYATFTGFGHDVNALYAWIGIVVVILGSVFVRQFWCKYLCPLGAATNVFTILFIPATILVAWWVLSVFGISIHWVVPLAVVSIAGFLAESIRMKSWVAPLAVVERVDAICTGCKKCDKACPMAIEVSTAGKVKDIDCHLCTDCIQVCPEKGALTINKKNAQWLPSFATVALVLGGIWLGSSVEIPTITEQWASQQEIEDAAIYEQSGLKSVKCFGSSKSFVTQMKNVDGVLGAQTFVGSHTVKIWYDSETITEAGIRESIFTPVKAVFAYPSGDAPVMKAVFGVDKLFDSYDEFYFESLLMQMDGVLAVLTQFGEPVEAVIYYLPGKVTPEEIRKQIESRAVTYEQQGVKVTQDVNFHAELQEKAVPLSAMDYKQIMFESEDWKFNGYSDEKSYAIYEIALPEALDPELAAEIPYLISHTSDDTGTVRFATAFEDSLPVARIYFVPEKSSPEKIFKHLNRQLLHIMYDDGDSEDVPNRFSFESPGRVIPQ